MSFIKWNLKADSKPVQVHKEEQEELLDFNSKLADLMSGKTKKPISVLV